METQAFLEIAESDNFRVKQILRILRILRDIFTYNNLREIVSIY